MLASLFRTAALRVPDRVIVHFDVALLAVVTYVQARALQEPHGAEPTLAPLRRLIPRRPAGYGLHVPAGLGEALDLADHEPDLGHLRFLLFGSLYGCYEGV